MSDELCFKTATEQQQLLRSRDISVRQLTVAHLNRIEKLNPCLNALVTLVADEALQDADKADEELGMGKPLGILHGLPIAIKDLFQTKGIRTTFGSPIYQDFIPNEDALHVKRLKHAGAIVLGKSNTPEFGAGSQTFNEVFGATRNPYDLEKTCGGSSGGAAVALATGMVPLADGSDLGGSLRNPASFCNIVGFRPSAELVPHSSMENAKQDLNVLGPMARTVEDVTLLLSAMAGEHEHDPTSNVFRQPLNRDLNGLRVALSYNLGDLPVEPKVNAICEIAAKTFTSLGATVEEKAPDLSDADEVFRTLRAWLFAVEHRNELEEYRHLIKDTVIWNTEQGLALSEPDIDRANILRKRLQERVQNFMKHYDCLLLPVSQVTPFPIEQPYVDVINGTPMETYIDWMRSCYYISVTGLPSISVPAGFTTDGLPVGIQLVGHSHGDFELLRIAHAFEQATNVGERRPAVKT